MRPSFDVTPSLKTVEVLEVSADSVDISKFVEARIEQLEDLDLLLTEPSREQVMKKIVEYSDGMYVCTHG